MCERVSLTVLRPIFLLLLAVLFTAVCPSTAGAQEKEQILFVAKQPKGALNVCVMNADGTSQNNLTKTEGMEVDPVWSADRKRIAFIMLNPKQGTGDVWVMNADGSERVQITKHEPMTPALAPSWSPDGTKIVFSILKARRAELFIVGADGNNRVNVGDGDAPAWSPDGKSILFTRPEKGNTEDPRLYLMDSDGKNARTLSRNKVMMASWSRDGKRIAYFGEVEGTRGICVMDADGTGAKLVRKLEGNTAMNQGEFGPQWSADGKRLFFTGCQLANPPTAAVFAMDTDGGNVKQLTDRKVLNFLGGGTVRHVRFTISKVEKP